MTSATDGLRSQSVPTGEEPPVLSPDPGYVEGTSAGTLAVGLLRLDPDLPPPSYAHPGDAGADLRAREDVTLRPGERRLVPTGVAIALPPGFVGLVHPRSGLATRHGLTVLNAPGTVDAGYRGEIMVTLLNTDRSAPVELRRGDRIAQLVVQRVERAHFVEVEALPDSVRGAGGFGSTGGFTGGFTSFDAADGPASPGPVAGRPDSEAGDSPGRGERS